MIFGIGTDIIEVERVREAIEKYGHRFLHRIFSETEIAYCRDFNSEQYQHFAARYAAKEAFSKALGTGLGKDCKFTDFCIMNDEKGKPLADISPEMLEKLGRECRISVSLSHLENYAVAFVTIEKRS